MDKKQKILIAEDSKINRAILKNILLNNNYDVVECENGEEAWKVLSSKDSKIDAVITELMMPQVGGYDLITKINNANMKDLPIIVTTSLFDNDSETKALDLGAWDFVPKPYNAKILLSRLKNAIARSQIPVYQEMQKIAQLDTLTNIYNRNTMFNQTKSLISLNPDKKFVFIKLDIDHFSLFNSSFGEKEGDELIKYFSNQVKTVAESHTPSTYGRINGDVFCMCIPYNNNEEIENDINIIHNNIAKYRKDYSLDISCGACLVNNTDSTIYNLFFKSSIATKQCKLNHNKNIVFFSNNDESKINDEIKITNNMQSALLNGEFIPYLQPKVNILTGEVCGAEVLVRWKDPNQGIISPGTFIPIFEKNGFISKLDYYMWDQTCKLLKKWNDKGINQIPLSVNLSRISLYNPKLAENITNLVEKYNLPHSLFQLEITESAYMSNPTMMANTIASLHSQGFTILMDDFGSGYSSLNTLKNIDIDILKIDMQFLSKDNDNTKGNIILASMIKMGNWLNIPIIVEGVENKNQVNFLKSAGCKFVQGYYYSQPIPVNNFEDKFFSNKTLAGSKEKENTSTNNFHQTLLVIDRSNVDNALLSRYFKNYTIKSVDTAEDGLEYLSKNAKNVKLIFIENVLEGMSGTDFIKYCKRDILLDSIPKIMIVSSDRTQDKINALNEGAFDYITRPFTPDLITSKLNHVLSLSRTDNIIKSNKISTSSPLELDPSTGLLNKVALRQLVTRILTIFPEDDNAFFTIDIDNFKQINDTYGHLAGDKIINFLAKELKNSFRKTDLVSRFGGDEFNAMMTKLSNHEVAEQKAKDLIAKVANDSEKLFKFKVNISVGITFSQKDDNFETLFGRSDSALYNAKNGGKSKYVIFSDKLKNKDGGK
jgi:diguanylate cyclase (GGDEF)-like protein